MLRKLAFALTLCASPVLADTVTIDTSAGPVEVAANPAKVAVFDIAALDSLAALGVKPVGTAAPVRVDYLDAAIEGAEAIGTLFEPDYEAVAALSPDLVIVGGRSAGVAGDLARIAPTIDMTVGVDTVGDGLARLAAYGKIFGKEAEAAELKAELEAKLETAKAAVAGKGDALIVMTNGPKISAYGSGGRFGWLHSTLGIPEAVDEVEQATHGEAISFEFIRDADPDILIVLDRLAAIDADGESAQATLDNALVHETKAWKTGKVIYLEPARLYIANGGITSMMDTLDQVIAAFSGS